MSIKTSTTGRLAPTTLAALLAVAGLAGTPASAQEADTPGEVVTAPAIQTIFPQRRAPRSIMPAWRPVEVRAVHADVVISGETARTTLAITLFNPSQSLARCELAVPVPVGAAISSFSLDGLEGDPPATLLPRDEARAAFEEIVRKMIDPGLLEFAGHGLIKSSVFPVPAGGEQTFRVTYEHAVAGEGDEIEYTLPRSGAMGAGPAWTVNVRLDAPEPIVSMFSPSHAVDFEIDDAGDATLDDAALGEPGAFRLVALRKPADGPAMSLFAYPDPERADAGFFMLVMAAGERDADTQPLPRDVTVVLDRSGSMQGDKFAQATGAALQIIRALGPEERFRIIDYSSDVATSGPAVNATKESIEAAAARLGELTAVGGTNINEALLEAVRPEPADGTLPIVLFLTDGLPTVGVTAEKAIRDNILAANAESSRRLFTFGVGHDVNVPLLTDLARESRAVADFVAPGDDVEAAVGRVFDRLSGPVLADVSLAALSFVPVDMAICGVSIGTPSVTNPISEVFPRNLGDLFEDQRQIVLGRYTLNGGGFDLTVKGQSGDGQQEHRITLNPADARTENAHIARLWAQQKVTWLIDELRSAGADPEVQQLDSMRDDPRLAELIDEVIHLSTTYGILTEYTAFLAAEEGVLAATNSPEFDLNTVFQRSNTVRSGGGAVVMGGAQTARRQATTAGRPMSVGENLKIAADSATEANDQVQGGGGGGISPFQDAAGLRLLVAEPADRGSESRMPLQQIGPDTLYRQDARWVDARIITQDQSLAEDEPRPEPDETVAFATPRYFEIASALASQNRQGLMAVPGEVEIMLDGRRVLVQNPS